MTEQVNNVIIFENMIGKTFNRVEHIKTDEGLRKFAEEFKEYINGDWDLLPARLDEVVLFVEADSSAIHIFYHHQDCFENVHLEDVTGELTALLTYPLLMAELVTQDATSEETDDEAQWSFYKFATFKGAVTMRWWGSSNGYYSVNVSYLHLPKV